MTKRADTYRRKDWDYTPCYVMEKFTENYAIEWKYKSYSGTFDVARDNKIDKMCLADLLELFRTTILEKLTEIKLTLNKKV